MLNTYHEAAFLRAADLRAAGAELTMTEVHDAVAAAWAEIRSRTAYGGKSVLSLPEDDFWAVPDFRAFKPEFNDQRLGWKLSTLYSVNSRFGGVKVIGANAFNRHLGLPRSTSTFVLLEKFTLRPVAILDGTALSAARTGTYASIVADRCLPSENPVLIFILGAGPVARSVIQSLSLSCRSRIERIFIRSRRPESALGLAAELGKEVPIPLIPVEDNRAMRDCAFVITASNARQPVFSDEDLSPNAITLHLGGNEVPESYLQRVLRTGLVVCDDLRTVSQRNSQSLALHFSRKGLSLETIGPLLGIREMSSPEDWCENIAGPVCVTCVGLPMLDLFVAQAAYEKYRSPSLKADEG